MCDEDETETAIKVVAIMQTIAEEHDDSSKRMWRKILGLSDELPKKKENKPSKENPE
ncbi:MAG: hypothetical protein ACXABE_16865 [Candidatus Thorarchaeota archaeon]|jgi:hypothetical protein